MQLSSGRILALLPLLLPPLVNAASVWSPELQDQTNRYSVSLDHQRPIDVVGINRPLSPSPPSQSENPLIDLRSALHVLQTSWFRLWDGTWPSAIDWTAAVVNTHLLATLRTFSKALHVSVGYHSHLYPDQMSAVENDLNSYFAHSTAYYFGEDAFGIRLQAYDDMLWVVLGWLEATRFVSFHTALHYADPSPWHGHQFMDPFAHRARTFYALTTEGWDTELCGGGMVWNSRLLPYKNAITNQLFISASVGMYLYFTGDENESPFLSKVPPVAQNYSTPHDPIFLSAAVEAYKWLKNVNMTNEQGLYIDGFHISGWSRHRPLKNKKCDIRNEEVYTYNQAVILSGLRALWEATGEISYLEDGHELIRNAISATGWSLENHTPSNSMKWSGLGRNGTLEELCDSRGRCSQDSQTFKGIYFHHLTTFCEPLPSMPLIPGVSHGATQEIEALHRHSCLKYGHWVKHNALTALQSKNEKGEFGMWWGASNASITSPKPRGGQDYRNDPSILLQPEWVDVQDIEYRSRLMPTPMAEERADAKKDLNDRGRGRTMETQSGGVSILRAWWEFENLKPT